MEQPASLLIGRETDNQLRITVVRRIAPSSHDWFDFGSLVCHVQIRAGGMRAEFQGIFRAEGLESLAHDLAELDRAFRPGVVTFEPGYEKSLLFDLTITGGHIGVSGSAVDGLGTGVEQRLSFRFEVEDSLRAILASAEAIAREFPPSPSTQLRVRWREPSRP